MWSSDPGFVKFDYRKVDEIPKELHHQFDYCVIDPPFITVEVWTEYARAAQLLLVEGEEVRLMHSYIIVSSHVIAHS